MPARSSPAEFFLAYRPPFDWPAMLAFLARRTVLGVEQVDERRYVRTAALEQHGELHKGWIEVHHDEARGALRVTMSASLAAADRELRVRLTRLFDLVCDPMQVARALGSLVRNPGLRVPGTFDGFEAAIRAILGQQVTVRAAHTIAGRFAAAFGERVDSSHAVSIVFPSACRIAGLDPVRIAEQGIVMQRAKAIVLMARALTDDRLRLDPAADVGASIEALQSIPGIGPWTAQYIAMRALRWSDAFPHTDYGVRKALGECTGADALRHAEQWRPWRAYAVMHLWKSLEKPNP
jgi:AraC family transcriptional regulator of adaptative response / DNA-3-methyladenine glycosylase II